MLLALGPKAGRVQGLGSGRARKPLGWASGRSRQNIGGPKPADGGGRRKERVDPEEARHCRVSRGRGLGVACFCPSQAVPRLQGGRPSAPLQP